MGNGSDCSVEHGKARAGEGSVVLQSPSVPGKLHAAGLVPQAGADPVQPSNRRGTRGKRPAATPH